MPDLPALTLPGVGRLARRDPAPRERFRRQVFVLTDRDRDVLAAVATHGFLTVALIGLTYYPLAAGPGAVSARAYHRVRQRWLWGFLQRVEVPLPRGFRGSRPSLYALGPAGVPYAAKRLLPGVDAIVRRVDRLEVSTIPHELSVAAFWANPLALLRSEPARLARWVPERALRARKLAVYDPETRRRLPVLPDAYAELAYADGRARPCMLEVDMGTLTLDRFRAKLRALARYQAEGRFERD